MRHMNKHHRATLLVMIAVCVLCLVVVVANALPTLQGPSTPGCTSFVVYDLTRKESTHYKRRTECAGENPTKAKGRNKHPLKVERRDDNEPSSN